MITSKKIRLLLRDLRPFIDPVTYQDTLFALSDFELYISRDETAEGNEYRILMDTFEKLLDELYELAAARFYSLSVANVDELLYEINNFLRDLGYDWEYRGEGVW